MMLDKIPTTKLWQISRSLPQDQFSHTNTIRLSYTRPFCVPFIIDYRLLQTEVKKKKKEGIPKRVITQYCLLIKGGSCPSVFSMTIQHSTVLFIAGHFIYDCGTLQHSLSIPLHPTVYPESNFSSWNYVLSLSCTSICAQTNLTHAEAGLNT